MYLKPQICFVPPTFTTELEAFKDK